MRVIQVLFFVPITVLTMVFFVVVQDVVENKGFWMRETQTIDCVRYLIDKSVARDNSRKEYENLNAVL